MAVHCALVPELVATVGAAELVSVPVALELALGLLLLTPVTKLAGSNRAQYSEVTVTSLYGHGRL